MASIGYTLAQNPKGAVATLTAVLDNNKSAKVSWNVADLDDAEAIVALRALADLIARRMTQKRK